MKSYSTKYYTIISIILFKKKKLKPPSYASVFVGTIKVGPMNATYTVLPKSYRGSDVDDKSTTEEDV